MDQGSLIEQIQSVRVQALELKNSGDRRGALEALRRAKAIEAQLRKVQEAQARAAENGNPGVESEAGIFDMATKDSTRSHSNWNAPSRALLRKRKEKGDGLSPAPRRTAEQQAAIGEYWKAKGGKSKRQELKN